MKGYGQFCPVAKASEILGERWTPLIVRELMCGSHRFNELRRGNPMMSPSILSRRLRTLEGAGVIERRGPADGAGSVEYHLTEAGRELAPIIMQMGMWGQRWARSQLTPEDYDPALLMWDMRRRIDVARFPPRRTVVSFEFIDAPARHRFYYLVVDRGEVDLCLKNPGFEVDLGLRTRVRDLADIWMGELSVVRAVHEGRLEMSGSAELGADLGRWLGYSVFAGIG